MAGMSRKEIQKMLIDMDLGVRPLLTLRDRLKVEHNVKISSVYLGMILRQERTGYKYRRAIAAVCGRKELEMFGPNKRSGRGSNFHNQTASRKRTKMSSKKKGGK
jgi:hypothetical protein